MQVQTINQRIEQQLQHKRPEVKPAVKEVNALPAHAIPGLKPAALNTMAEKQIQSLTTDQLMSMSKKQLKKSHIIPQSTLLGATLRLEPRR